WYNIYKFSTGNSMNTFPQVLAEVQENALTFFREDLDLTQGSDAYFFFDTLAQVGFIFEEALGVLENNLSVFSALGNNLNSLGVFLNYKSRPYYNFFITCNITGPNGLIISPGLEVIYPDPFGNLFYFKC